MFKGDPKKMEGQVIVAGHLTAWLKAVQGLRIVITKTCGKIWKKRKRSQRMSTGEGKVR
jgi:hypothetical protein